MGETDVGQPHEWCLEIAANQPNSSECGPSLSQGEMRDVRIGG